MFTAVRRGVRAIWAPAVVALSTQLGLPPVEVGGPQLAAVAAVTAQPSGPVLQGAAAGLPETVGADALPTWQLNGVVWSQAIVGNTVYVTGQFSKARPPGKPIGDPSEVPAANLFAYNIQTGERVASFNHALNAQGLVMRASPDGRRVYVGGDFTAVDGVTRQHVAAFDTADGSLVTDFAPYIGGQVRALAVSPTAVYVGGNFLAAGSVTDLRSLAAFAPTGAELPWRPTVGGASPVVFTMVLAPDGGSVVLGGSFDTLNAVTATGMGAVSTAGAVLPWAANERIKTSGIRGAINALKTDGVNIFGAGQSYSDPAARFEGTFSATPNGGSIRWVNDCLGDSYDVAMMSGVVYSVHHAHDCRPIHEFGDTNPRNRWTKATAAPDRATGTITELDEYTWDFRGLPYAGLLQWYPDLSFGTSTPAGQAAWSVEAANGYVVLGGEFPKVNDVPQQSLTRFAVAAKAPSRSGPIISAASTPTTMPTESGTKVSWRAAWDRDDAILTYEVYRGTTKIATMSQDSSFWYLPGMSVIDPTAFVGATYSVRVLDSEGNAVATPSVVVGAEVKRPDTAYMKTVMGDSPMHYWAMDDQVDAARTSDRVGGAVLTGDAVVLGASPAVVGTAATAGAGSRLVTDATDAETAAVSVEAWIKPTASTGRIIGRGSDNTRDSLQRDDAVLYLDSTGRLALATTPDKTKALTAISSAAPITTNTWHHVVGTAGPGGRAIYLDGVPVAFSPAPVQLARFCGFWRLLDDSVVNLPNAPSTRSMSGGLDEVAVYARELDPATVLRHYQVGTGAPNLAPTAAFGASIDLLKVSVDASSSTDPDGQIRTYAWDFGDGSSAGGVTAVHTYGAPGTYVVTLAVTDDRGATATTARTATVGASTPVASDAFARTMTGGWGSADLGGPWATTGILSRWSVGDGVGRYAAPAGGGTPAALGISRTDSDVRVTVSTDKTPVGGAQFYSVLGRTSAAGDYRGKLRLGTDGMITAYLSRVVSGAETVLASAPLTGVTYAGGTRLQVRMQAFGINPTQLRLKVWSAGSAEPGAWTLTATDTTTALQSAGGVGVAPYLSAAATNGPVVFSTDDLIVTSNALPTALINSTVLGRTATLDASGSTDPDGTIVATSWTFGDGTTGTGAATTHTYALAGTYVVTATVTDDRGASARSSKSVVIQNAPPNASFVSTVTFLDVAFDASASRDPDGTIVTYSWDFGDGTTGTGVQPRHSYAAPGTYTASLTVTDNEGGKNQTTGTLVTVSLMPSAQDSFTRSIGGGWGNADLGGAWTNTGTAGLWAVNGSVGTIALTPGTGGTASINSTSRTDTEVAVLLSTTVAPTGGGQYLTVIGRGVSAGTDYRAKLRLSAGGGVNVYLARSTAGVETVLSWATAPALVYAAGDRLQVRLQVYGTAPSTLRVKVWKVGTPEPLAWLLTSTDTAAAQQQPGGVGLTFYQSSSAAAGQVVFSADDLWVGPRRP
jgi:PKD repeat protein